MELKGKKMMELSKDELIKRLKRHKEDGFYLYQFPQIASTNKNYISYLKEYIDDNEIDKDKPVLKNIQQITRGKSYFAEHNTEGRKNCTNRAEEHIVLDLYEKSRNKNDPIFNKLIDYQIPLKNHQEDKAGKIDFIFYQNNKLYLAEIKAPRSEESLLKAILEIQTYYQIVNKEMLLNDLQGKYPKYCSDEIGKCVVIFDNTKAAEQYKCECFKKYIEMFNIRVIVLSYHPSDFSLCIDSNGN